MSGTQRRIVLKRRPWRTTEIDAGPPPVFVKRFHDARFPGAAVGRWRDLRRARREARTLDALARAAVRAPAVRGVVETEHGVELRLELVPGARALDTVLDACDARLARALGAALARLHAAGYAHGDLHAGNVLVDESGEIWIVDAAAIRRASAGAAARDLVHAAAEARERTTARFRARFFLEYARRGGDARRAEAAALVEAIEGAARVARRERVRAENDRWRRASGACALHVDGDTSVIAPHATARDEALELARRALRGLGDTASVVVRDAKGRRAWREMTRLVEHRVACVRPLVAVESPRSLAVFEPPDGARPPARGSESDARALGALAGALWDRGLALRHADVLVGADGVACVSVAARLVDATTVERALDAWSGNSRDDACWTSAPFRDAFVAAQRGSRHRRAALRASLEEGRGGHGSGPGGQAT